MINGLSLNALDIDSTYIINTFNNNQFDEGINILVSLTSYVETLSIKCSDDKMIQYIIIVNTLDNYQKMVNRYKKTKHIVLYNSNSIFDQFKYALNFVTKSHVLFMSENDKCEIVNKIDKLEFNVTYIPEFSNRDTDSSILNNMFIETNKSIEILKNDSLKKEDKIEINQPKKLNHPNLIKIENIEIVENEVITEKTFEYPLSLLFDKLFYMNGILFDTSIMQIAFENTSIFKEVILKYITFTDGIKKIKAFTYLRKTPLKDKDNNDYYHMLKFIDNLMDYRNNITINSALQYQADKNLYHLGNEMDANKINKTDILEKIEQLKLKHVELKALNKGKAETLVIAYCFPPYNDTSGNVMAKRIQETGEVVDVITNKMDKIRNKDESLNYIANEYIDSQFILNAPQAFSSFDSIDRFMSEGIEVFKHYPNKYKKMYSRAMFPASHFLAFEIKNIKPSIKWVAEFSDPLHTDVNSEVRYSPIKDNEYIAKIQKILPKAYKKLADDNVFNLCEILPLAFADNLIFTNEHQLKYMISRFDNEIKNSIIERAIIKQHPTLPKSFYEVETSYYKVAPNKINLAYFGNFYDTRGFREIELVCKYLIINDEKDFTIHVFTNVNSKVLNMYENSAFKDYICINPYVNYFEFLNLSNKMDGLLIFDAHTIGIKSLNPYLPSKLSDYLGSNAFTIAFIEEDSILSKQTHPNLLKVNMNHFSEYVVVYRQLKEKLKK